MEAPRALALLRPATLLIAAGQVVQVGLRHRQRRVGASQLRHLSRVVARGLEPWPEVPRRLGRGLPAGRGGEAPQRGCRRGPGEHPQRERRRRGCTRALRLAGRSGANLNAPGARGLGAQPEVARLGVVHQHAIAAGGEQPRHREVGCVVAALEAPGRHHRPGDGAVLLRIGTLAHVVLHDLAPLVHRVRSLAEAQEPLAPARSEGHAEGGDPGPGAHHLGSQADDALPFARQAHRQAAAGRVVGGQHGNGAGPAAAAQGQRARGVAPHTAGLEAQRSRGPGPRAALLREHRPALRVGEPQIPGRGPDTRAQGARVHPGLGCRRGGQGKRREHGGGHESPCAAKQQCGAHSGTIAPARGRGNPQPCPQSSSRAVTPRTVSRP